MDGSAIPVEGSEPFHSSRRNFIILGHRAVSDGSINLKDLCGASGRWDGIARCITSALFLSHAMRRDTSIHIVLMGAGDPPKILTISGSSVKYLNPDERACSALMRKNLSIPISPDVGRSYRTSPGIYVTRGDLKTLLSELDGLQYLLDESGKDIGSVNLDLDDGNLNFIMSDDRDFSVEDIETIEPMVDGTISVGPLPLHSYQAMIIVHNILDRMTIPSS